MSKAADLLADRDVLAEMRARCEYCGGTGDVHRMDGEWLGYCHCEYGQELKSGSLTAETQRPVEGQEG